MTSCHYCAEPLTPSEGGGRPSAYCSNGCRRAAQSERQRIVRHLERAESEAMDLRHAARRGDKTHMMSRSGLITAAERLGDVESDITELRERLRQLLTDGE